MKKLLVLALASVSFLLYAASLYAADLKFSGDYRVRGIYTDNTRDANDDLNDQTAFADGRFRLKTTATAGMVTGVVVVDFTASSADPTNGGCTGPTGTGCRTGNYTFGAANFGGSYNIVGVREAYLALDLGMVKVAAGRKPFKLGNGLILEDTADALAAKFMAGPLNVVLANAKLVESTVTGVGGTGSDTDLYIAKAGFTHGDMHEVGVFAAYLNDRNDSLALVDGTPFDDLKSDLLAIGVTAGGPFGPLNVNLEVDFLNGTNETAAGDNDLEGLNILASVGLNVGVDLGVTFVMTSGEDTAAETNVNGISGNFVLGNILVNQDNVSDRSGQCASIGGGRFGTGSPGCIGGLGVTAVKASAGFQRDKNCHIDAAVIWARTTEDPPTPGADSDLGIEIDANMHHKLDDNTTVVVNLGYVLSGDAFKSPPVGLGDDNQLLGKVTLNYMF